MNRDESSVNGVFYLRTSVDCCLICCTALMVHAIVVGGELSICIDYGPSEWHASAFWVYHHKQPVVGFLHEPYGWTGTNRRKLLSVSESVGMPVLPVEKLMGSFHATE